MLFPIDDLESRLAKKIGGSSSQVSLPTASHTATTSTTPTIRTCSMLPPHQPQENITITTGTAAQKRSGSSLEKLKQPEVKKLKLGMDIARNASIACGHVDALELAEKMAPPADLERLEGQETEELFKSSIHKSMEAMFHILELHKRMAVCMSELKTYEEEKESLKKELSEVKKMLENEVEKVSFLTSQIAIAEANIISLTKEMTTTMKSPASSLSDEVVAAYFQGKVKMQQQIYQVLRDRFPDFDICSWNLPVELQFQPPNVIPVSTQFATPPSSSNNTMIPPLVMLEDEDAELLDARFEFDKSPMPTPANQVRK